MLPDIEIARQAAIKPIQTIAQGLGIAPELLEPYGKYKAKLPLSLIKPEGERKGKLILVTAISPTPAGEGKTTTSVGLAMALNRIGKKGIAVLREPSLGPVFGMKGGAAGGGYAQVIPMEDINLHFTGDFNAIEKAHNLLAALIDNNLQSKTRSLGLDPRQILWKRVMDMNDRSLRDMVIGLGGTANGIPREAGFDITAASEIMAILCLSRSLADLKERIGNILVGFTYDKQPVYAHQLNAAGAMAVLLKDALQPNLVQTLENTPAILHGGPFANIAQGTNTLMATQMGLSLGEYVVTEGGFGADLGAEKFLDIKCTAGNLRPDAVVLVATLRALKYHGGVKLPDLNTPNPEAVRNGAVNLQRHLENLRKFGLPVVIALNHFPTDTDEESEVLANLCEEWKTPMAHSRVFAEGGKGGEALARIVVELAESRTADFKPLYEPTIPLKEKIETIAREIYRADGVDYAEKARTNLARIEALGLGHLAVCIAKTQYSFSHDPLLLGAPTGFRLQVREVELAAGAGFIVPICGAMMRMPGLPAIPAAEHIDIDADGNVTGLS
jgi:formate--tetrahydrofolate ligase